MSTSGTTAAPAPTSSSTPAERLGFTAGLARCAAELAAAQMVAGDLDTARTILEGLAIANPHDPAPWALLATLERRRGKHLAARLCAETALRLAPGDRQVRLARAEVLLLHGDARADAVAELTALSEGDDPVAARAGAFLVALGER